MGKGDQRTKRGKIARGSYGKTRPRKAKLANKNKTVTSRKKKK
ncbi:MAG: 30S ribosomal protein THX [Deltaproteobacteria bacterium]|nr:30S ribosomal protein THX [Deltaproteobacteria bacterium]